MNTRSLTARPLAALLITTVVSTLTFSPVVFAQPAKDASKPAEASGTTATPTEDDQLYSCKKRTGGTVAVTFKPETELKDLITWVMGFTCKNFILDPRIVSTGKKFTLIAPNKVSTSEAYNMFLVALSTMGLTVVPKGSTMRIVESSAAKSETVPIYKKGVPGNQDQIIRYVLRPTYAQVETLRTALDGIRSTAGSVTAAGSMLIITDYASQVRDMMTLARAIDVPGNNDGIYTIAVKHADATQLAQKINEILGLSAQGAAAGGATQNQNVGKRPAPAAPGAAPSAAPSSDDVSSSVPSKILVDDRTNTLIVVASEAGYLRVKSLVERLDITLDNEAGSSIRVYPLENALAEELATTLNNALGQGQSNQGGRPGQTGANGARPPGQPAPQPSPIGDLGTSLEGTVRVIGDKPTNSLIIMSSGRDYLAVKDVIKRLDQPRRQVFIEALVLEVNLDDNLTLGTSFHGGLPFNDSDLIVGGVQSANLKSLNVASLASLTGLIGGAIGSPLANSDTLLGTSIPSYGILVQALATQTNSNVLSTPHIIAIDNEKAEFSVGNNIPYKAGLSFGGFGLPTSGAAGGAAGLAGSVGQNIQREKLNLSLNITPHISSNDAVRLEVEQETKDLGSNDPELGPTWTERKLKTQVVVSDQATVVIGGLIQEKDIYGVSKVPLLGDIPILGYLFKYSTKQKHKTNLLILLTPYIVKDQTDLQSIRERKVREREEFVHSFTNLNEMKYEPRIDYRRKRGMVEEINRSVLTVEQDAEVLKALNNRKGIIEGPIEYGPSGIDDPADQQSQPKPAPKEPEIEIEPAPKKAPAKKTSAKAPAAKKAAE